MSKTQKFNELREGKTSTRGVDSEVILDDTATIPGCAPECTAVPFVAADE